MAQEVTDPELLKILNGGSTPAPTPAPTRAPGVIRGAPKPEDPPKPNEPPSGYRWGPNGTLVPIPGGPADKPAGDAKDNGKIGALDSVVGQINRVQELYNAGIRDENFKNLWGALDNFGPTAGQFNSAGAGLGDQGMAAFKVPGAGPQSDADAARFVQANQPTASDWDTAIEEKLRTLRARVDANRKALGLPPAQWTGLNDSKQPADTPPPMMPPAGTGGGQPMAPVQGNMRAVDNPELANKAFAMWRSGKSLDEISAYVQSQGYGPIIPNQETLDYARKHPGWNPFSATKYEPVSTFEKAITTTFGNDPYGVAGYGIGAGQFLSGNTLDNLAADPERARLAMDVAAQQSPTGTALGTVSGGVLGSILGEVALARAGMAPGVARSLIADTGYGAANGAGMADAQGQSRTANALLGAVYAGGGNIAGRTVGRGVNAFGRGVQNSATRSTINNVGDLTVGQVYGQSGRVGGALRGVEDRLSGLPIVGDSINAARARSFESFNAKAFDKALEPIGQKLSGEVGADALNAANMKVQQAFKDALDGKSVVADQPFVNEITQATMKAMSIGRVGPELSENIADILGPHMQQGKNGITGEEMQIISQELRALKAAYKKSEPAMYKRISAAIDSTENAIFGMFRRQAPDVVPKYNAAKQAYRRVSILADAQLAAKNQPDNMVTPAQLNAADAANAKKYEGSIKAASGQRQFRDLAEPAQAVLPNKVPDSGTAGRLLVAGAGVGGVVGGGSAVASGDPTQVGSGAGTGLMLSAIFMGAYTKAGQRILTKPGRGTPALTDPRIQRILSKLGAATGAVSLPESSPAP